MPTNTQAPQGKPGPSSRIAAILRLAAPVLALLFIGGLALAFQSPERLLGFLPDIPLRGDGQNNGPAVLTGSHSRERSGGHGSGGSGGSTIDLSMAIDPDLFNAALSISEADSPDSSSTRGSIIPRLDFSSSGGSYSRGRSGSGWNPQGHYTGGNASGSFSSLSGFSAGSGASGGSSGDSGGRSGYNPAALIQQMLAAAGSSGSSGSSTDSSGSTSGSDSGDSGGSSSSPSPMLLQAPLVVAALDTGPPDPQEENGGGSDAPVPNPEPGTLVLGGMGLASLMAARRRMKAGKAKEE